MHIFLKVFFFGQGNPLCKFCFIVFLISVVLTYLVIFTFILIFSKLFVYGRLWLPCFQNVVHIFEKPCDYGLNLGFEVKNFGVGGYFVGAVILIYFQFVYDLGQNWSYLLWIF